MKFRFYKMIKKKYFKLLFLSMLFYSLNLRSAFAYLDPGTGSVILQAIIAAIATASATIAFYWRKFKLLFKKIFGKKEKKDLSDK